MATLVSGKRHPALDFDVAERVDYLLVVAHLAAVDDEVADTELDRLRTLCADLHLGDGDAERVLAAAKTPAEPDEVDRILDRLAGSGLKFALLVDALHLARADDHIDAEEDAAIRALCAKLGINQIQEKWVRHYVERYRAGRSDPDAKKTTAKIVGAGIPMAALAVASAAGAPIAAGLGLAAALGLSGLVSIKWLLRGRKRASAKPKRARDTKSERAPNGSRQK
jgi:uncharacterized tellurite resistance protein B-like protein